MIERQEPGSFIRSWPEGYVIYGIGQFKNDRLRILTFYSGERAWLWFKKDAAHRSLWALEGRDAKVEKIELAIQRIQDSFNAELEFDHSENARARRIQTKCKCVTNPQKVMIEKKDIPIEITDAQFEELFTRARDDAKGLPSASGMNRYSICPASFYRSKGAEEEVGIDAIWGTLMHASVAGMNLQLPDEQKIIVDACAKQWDTLSSSYDGETVSEIRYFIIDDNMRKVASAKLDRIKHSKDRALIVDFKTGWNEPPATASNMQIRTQVVAAKEKFSSLKRIDAAIIQPLLNSNPVLVTYDEDAMARSREQILGVIQSIEERFPVVPCPTACHFCPAKSGQPGCPEYVSWIDSLMPEKWRNVQFSGKWDAAKFGVFLDCRKQLVAFIDALEERARSFLENNPNSIPGWTLRPTRPRRVIRNDVHPMQVYNRLLTKLDHAEVIGCYSRVSLDKIKLAIAKKHKLSAKEATIMLGKTLEDMLFNVVQKPRFIKLDKTGVPQLTAEDLTEETIDED